MWKKCYIPLSILFLAISCSQGGNQGAPAPTSTPTSGPTSGEREGFIEAQPSQPGSPQPTDPVDAEPSSGVRVQKVLVPLDMIQIPCAQITGSPDESEIILTIPEAQVENCPGSSFLWPTSFDLIPKAYAAEKIPERKYRFKCLKRCRLKKDKIEFDLPFEDAQTLERQLLLLQTLAEWRAILSITLNDPTKDLDYLEIVSDQLLFETKAKEENDFAEAKDKEDFKKKFHEQIKREKKGELNEGEPGDTGKKEEPEKDEDKIGWKKLGDPDLKFIPPRHHLKLLLGRKWESGDFDGRFIHCAAEDPAQYRIVSVQYFNPHPHRTDLKAFLTLKGLADGEAIVSCKTEIKGHGPADLVIHLTVEDPSKPKPEPVWEWKLPAFKDNELYFGDIPMCTNADGNPSYITDTGSLQSLFNDNYSLILSEGGSWLRNMIGPFRYRDLKSSDENVAAVFRDGLKGFRISAKKRGSALISWEAIRVKDKDQVVPQEAWKKVQIVVSVFPFLEEEGERLCPGEVKVEAPKLDTCPAPEVQPPAEPDHSVEPPATLTKDEQALADKLYQLFEPDNTPPACSDAMLRRQAKKLAHGFYSVPTPDYLLASCVTCANNVGNGLVESLRDEKISCFKIQNIGRGNFPILDVPTHAATAVYPACSEINDQSLVLDTWFAPGNWIPSLHQHRVFRLADWKSGKLTDFGLEKSQTNLPK